MAEPNSVPEQENPAASSALPDVASVGVGSALRMRREQLGWTLPQIADWLRIREAYLEALESGRAGVFPAEAYALGFLRTYAQAMGFDAEDVVQRYKREGKVRNRKPELTFPAPPPDRRIPPGVTVSLGLLVLVGAYVGWYQFVGHAPPVPEHVPPVAEIIPGEKTANAPSPQVASILPDPGASPPPQPVAPPATSVPSGAAAEHSSPTEASNAPLGLSPDTGKETSPVTGNVAEGVSPSMAEGQGASPENSEGAASAGVASDQLVVKADAASWVQVKDGAGKVVYDHIMQPGDQWNVPQDNGPYSLTVGNAGGIMVAAGTMITPHLGRNGAVRRKLALTVDAMRDGSLAGAPVAIAPSTSPSQSSVPAPQVSPGETPAVPKREVGPQQDRTVVEGREASSPAPDGRKPDAASAQPDQGGVVQENAPTMPIRPAPAPRRKSSPPPETSADDLNARQLQGLGGH